MNTIRILTDIYSRCISKVPTPTIAGLLRTIIGFDKIFKILLLEDIVIAIGYSYCNNNRNIDRRYLWDFFKTLVSRMGLAEN